MSRWPYPRVFVDVNRAALARVIQTLTLHQLGEVATLLDERVVGAVFDDPATVEHLDPVAVTDGGETVGDDQAGATHGVK